MVKYMNDTQRFLTPKEVADLVRSGRKTIYLALHSGELHGVRAGGKWIIRRDWVDEWLKIEEGKR
jgi:excisionase family DNA binding protein